MVDQASRRTSCPDPEPTAEEVEAFIKAATAGWEQPYHGYHFDAVYRGLVAAKRAAASEQPLSTPEEA